MDFWKKIEELKTAEGIETDAELARSIKESRSRSKGKGLSDGYFWNVKQRIHRLGPDVVHELARRMEVHGILSGRLDVFEFKEACRTMPLRDSA
jgi:hypothetical protein